MYESWFVAATMMTAPTRKTALESCSAHFRPIFSVTASHVNIRSYPPMLGVFILRKQKMAPKKAPAWNDAVILLEILFASEPYTLKSRMKLSRAIVVPTNAES